MTYNETPLAREAKTLLKVHLGLPDGVAQTHVDTLSERDLADLVASNDYPLHDRPGLLRSVLTRSAVAPTPARALPPPAATPDPPAAPEQAADEPVARRPRRRAE